MPAQHVRRPQYARLVAALLGVGLIGAPGVAPALADGGTCQGMRTRAGQRVPVSELVAEDLGDYFYVTGWAILPSADPYSTPRVTLFRDSTVINDQLVALPTGTDQTEYRHRDETGETHVEPLGGAFAWELAVDKADLGLTQPGQTARVRVKLDFPRPLYYRLRGPGTATSCTAALRF